MAIQQQASPSSTNPAMWTSPASTISAVHLRIGLTGLRAPTSVGGPSSGTDQSLSMAGGTAPRVKGHSGRRGRAKVVRRSAVTLIHIAGQSIVSLAIGALGVLATLHADVASGCVQGRFLWRRPTVASRAGKRRRRRHRASSCAAQTAVLRGIVGGAIGLRGANALAVLGARRASAIAPGASRHTLLVAESPARLAPPRRSRDARICAAASTTASGAIGRLSGTARRRAGADRGAARAGSRPPQGNHTGRARTPRWAWTGG